jgi:hypothetical protein
VIVANHATGSEDDDAGRNKKIDTGLGSQGKNAVAMNVLAQLTTTTAHFMRIARSILPSG